jgi:hypothetical protein
MIESLELYTIDLHISNTGLMSYARLSVSTEIDSKFDEHEGIRLSRRRRKRGIGAGRLFKLKVKERFFLMLLVYYRLYIRYTLSEFLFDLNQSNVYREISILEPLVKRCIPLLEKLYKRTRRRTLRTIDEVEEYFSSFKAFIDSTEQEIPTKIKCYTTISNAAKLLMDTQPMFDFRRRE